MHTTEHVYQDTRPIHINSLLLNGGIVYTGDNSRVFYDSASGRYVLIRALDRYVFETLEACACFLAFSHTDRALARKKDPALRFEWFVLDLNEVYAVFSRKKEAIACCHLLNDDRRLNKSIYKLENGLYEYTSPARSITAKNFYIGVRAVLLKNGFAPVIERWDKRLVELSLNAEKHKMDYPYVEGSNGRG